MSMWSTRASSTTISPPAIPTAARNVAATTRSEMTWCVGGLELVDPFDAIREVPAPVMMRPHRAEEHGKIRDLGLAGARSR